MITGTIRFSDQDFALSRVAFSQGQPISLWLGAGIMACLGAVIGFGLAMLASKALPAVSPHAAWGAVCGAILAVSAGAWKLSAKQSPMQSALLQIQQTFVLDDNGVRLGTDTAQTDMSWAHFVAARIAPEWMVLKTREETVVLLRPAFFADPADWREARRIVGANVATASG
ncbi:MAG: hypothetical protein M9932_03415 [Xanthobacteraceae bacterium]|nr:hypothetical protein [Xanthobacteraceae bacterium]